MQHDLRLDMAESIFKEKKNLYKKYYLKLFMCYLLHNLQHTPVGTDSQMNPICRVYTDENKLQHYPS